MNTFGNTLAVLLGATFVGVGAAILGRPLELRNSSDGVNVDGRFRWWC